MVRRMCEHDQVPVTARRLLSKVHVRLVMYKVVPLRRNFSWTIMTEVGCRVILPVGDTQDVLNYGIPCTIRSQRLALAAINHYWRPHSEHFVNDRSVMCTSSLAQ
jgi:hypothetical protein